MGAHRPGELDGPTVVDIARGGWISDMEPRPTERDSMARMVVKLVNKVNADLDCTGTIADPVERLPKAARLGCGPLKLKPPRSG
ncbi:hypothetical protein [Streptomyces sp. NPDC058268]|uniref:hypothetical protein n=1 Tax=Streptomyces sp. NPDC058268 TaxID=3346413 RepID=UPI0036DFEE19